MAKLFEFPNVRNKPARNGFDISGHRFFTSKAGELLPAFVKEVVPGDKLKIDLASFTRTRPVQTAAFTRLKEQVEFYFVPYRLLWKRFPEFIRSLGDSSAKSPDSIKTTSSPTIPPVMMMSDIQDLLGAAKNSYAAGTSDPTYLYSLNDVDQPVFSTSEKLLNYLGYGRPISGAVSSIDTQFPEDAPDTNVSSGTIPRALRNYPVSVFPLLAYQKIYQDHYRVDDWETYMPQTYNCDYLTGTASSNVLPITQFTSGSGSNFKLNATPWFLCLRYRNYRKDMFMGLKPSNPLVDVLATPNFPVADSSVSNQSIVGILERFGSSSGTTVRTGDQYTIHIANNFLPGTPSPSKGNDVSRGIGEDFSYAFDQNNIGISVFSIKRAEAFAKFAQIQAVYKHTYKDYVARHMDYIVPDSRAQLSEFLGSFEGDIVINEVLNTNLVSDDPVAKGNGISQMNGREINFEASEHGIVMGIYSVIPQLDYASSGLDPVVVKSDISDFFIPEFDRLGLEPMSEYLLSSNQDNAQDTSQMLAYAPRYIGYKTGKDTIHGDFLYTRQDWVAPLSLAFLRSYLVRNPGSTTPKLSYSFFKVHPGILNSIFGVPVTGSVTTDQFDVALNVDCKKVSAMDVDGMPF